jgi:Protein of unknown function (DUF2442)
VAIASIFSATKVTSRRNHIDKAGNILARPVRLGRNFGFCDSELRVIEQKVREQKAVFIGNWNEYSAALHDVESQDVQVTETALRVTLRDGRVIGAPLDWFPHEARAEDRRTWEPSAARHGIRSPLIDEDLSAEGLLCASISFAE